FDARPFTDRHVDLLPTFADQAVIAIENVRLFNETKESLERQTATSELLTVISQSTFDLQPVLEIVMDKAVALCRADHAWLRLDDLAGRNVVYRGPSLEALASLQVIAISNVQLFREIQQKSAELAAASRHKSEFLANMSHELRTPLNAIIGFSDVLEQRLFGELNERQADYTRDIASSGRHLLDLVNEILDLSKVEAGRMELEPSEFSLAETILGAVGFVRERAAAHGIALATDLPVDLGTLVADE